MAKVNVTQVTVFNNPDSILAPFKFEITFTCNEELNEDLEWQMKFIGSVESDECDQVLETICVGPIPIGCHMFVFDADPPDVTKIPERELVAISALLISCSFRNQEFIRICFFICTDYADEELRDNPPRKPVIGNLSRNILATRPRIKYFKIDWEAHPSLSPSSSSDSLCSFNFFHNPKFDNVSDSDDDEDGNMMFMHNAEPLEIGDSRGC